MAGEPDPNLLSLTDTPAVPARPPAATTPTPAAAPSAAQPGSTALRRPGYSTIATAETLPSPESGASRPAALADTVVPAKPSADHSPALAETIVPGGQSAAARTSAPPPSAPAAFAPAASPSSAATLVAGPAARSTAETVAVPPPGMPASAPTVSTLAGAVAAAMGAGDPAALDQLIGRELGGCTVERLLGKGGMGAVFRATQRSLNRSVALKVMLPGREGDPQFAERFVREARLVAQLNHPHVVQVYDSGRDLPGGSRDGTGMLYMVMEYVTGRTLGQVIKAQGALPPLLALEILRQAADGLAAAHALGQVHRDLKPDNLMIAADGRVKIMDFGLARVTGASGDSGLTMSGMVLGTPAYLSPEGARGETTDIRSDLYSLGITLWQAIAGKLPFTAPTPVQVMALHLEAPPPPLRQAVPGCPPAVADLCSRLMAKDPAARLPDPAALRDAIAGLQREMSASSVTLRWQGELLKADVVGAAAAPAARSHRGLFLVLGALAVAAVGGALVLSKPASTPQDPYRPTPGATAAGQSQTVVPSAGHAAPLVQPTATSSVVPDAGHTAVPAPTTPVVAQPVVTQPVVAQPVVALPAALPVAPDPGSRPQPSATAPIHSQTPQLSAQSLPTSPAPVAPVAPAGPPIVTATRIDAATVPTINRLPASLSITGVEAGAQIVIDGFPMPDATPALIRDLQPGLHQVHIRGPGAFSATHAVVLVRGRVIRLPADQGLEHAQVELVGLPVTATATIAGLSYRPGVQLPTGSATIVVTDRGQRSAYTIDLNAGGNRVSLPTE